MSAIWIVLDWGVRHHDLIIIGTGSGNTIPGDEFAGWDVALVERGTFGGTCLNVGCIPSKMFVYSADVVETVRHAATFQVDARVDGVDWPALVGRVFDRIDPIAAAGERYRVEDCDHVTVYRGDARFVGHKTLRVDLGDRVEEITADHIVLGAGSRPFVPPVPGLAETGYFTSDDIMRIDGVPKRLAILGGGYIGAELGHVFDAMGSEVTVLVRSGTMLRGHDQEIATRATEIYGRRLDVRCRTHVERVFRDDSGIVLGLDQEGDQAALTVDAVLVAAGRVPNGDVLDVAASGVETVEPHRVQVDSAMRTNVEGVWAFGDLANPYQLKHIANMEASVISHNLRNPDDLRHMDYRVVPQAVFANPQIAAVGINEQEAVELGVPHMVARQDYAGTAYGWAIEDRTSFAKVIAHAETREVLGAHIIGPHASTLIHPLVQAMHFGQTVDQLAHDVVYIHPALTEVVENAVLQFQPAPSPAPPSPPRWPS